MYGPAPYSWFLLQVRGFFNILDIAVYSLISAIYQIFFNVASSTILSGETVRNLFARVQLILGIFILFKLALSLINGVINPDSISDKSNGFDKIVRRIIVALIMLVLVIPLNIPGGGSTSYEKQINNNGILFGTLYEFQNRILSENTLARLILNQPISSSNENDRNKLSDFGDTLSAIILKTFVVPNLKDEDTEKSINSYDDLAKEDNLACSDDVDKVQEWRDSGSVRYILSLTGEHCNASYGGERFTFDYSLFISTVVGVLFLIIMVGFTFDIAIRAFKLVILRLIAPIPILSYIDQKNDNGAFSTWVKMVTSTYLDLFLRVAIVLFIVFIINEFYNNGIILDVSSGVVGTFSWLFIILALFFFARQAPKFILDSLGIKSEFNIFRGITTMLGGVAAGVSATRTGFRASQIATDRNDEANETQSNRGLRALKALGSGAAGFVSGAYHGVNDAAGAKEHALGNALKNSRARNREALANADLGSTWWARTQNNFSENVLGDNEYQRLSRQEALLKKQLEDRKHDLEVAKATQSAGKEFIDFAKGEAAKTGKGAKARISIAGNNLDMDLDKWNARVQAARSAGSNTLEIDTRGGGRATISLEDAIRYQSDVEEDAAFNYAIDHITDAPFQQRVDALRDVYEQTVDTTSAAGLKSSIKTDIYVAGFSKINDIENVGANSVNTLEGQLRDVRDKMPRAQADARDKK